LALGHVRTGEVPAKVCQRVERARRASRAGQRSARQRYVKSTATGANNGSSWTDAYTDLQSAIANVVAFDQIWLASGVYTAGTQTFDSFVLPNRVVIRGGFFGTPGSEGNPNARDPDPTTNGTVLSGNGSSEIIVIANSVDANTILESVAISGSTRHAIEAIDSQAQFIRLHVTANYADLSNSGAGMFISGSGLGVNVTDTLFDFNEAEGDAGAVYITGAGDHRPIFQSCRFENNESQNSGGAVAVANGAPSFRDWHFEANAADSDFVAGGAIHHTATTPDGLHFEVRGCTFVENHCLGEGGTSGAIHLAGNVGANAAHWLVANTFIENEATLTAGAVLASGNGSPHMEMVNNRFYSNSTEGDAGAVQLDSNCNVTNSVFSGNFAEGTGTTGFGGAILHNTRLATITNCTIYGSSGTKPTGSGIYSKPFLDSGDGLTLRNTILWSNLGADVVSEAAQLDYLHDITPEMTNLITDSCIHYLGFLDGSGSGNIGLDPLFVDADGIDGVVGTLDDQLGLQALSPCIDEADSPIPSDSTDVDSSGTTGEATPDLALRPRELVGRPVQVLSGCTSNAVADMGSAEFLRDEGSCTACTSNGTPDYLEIEACPAEDSDGNGRLDWCEDCNANSEPDGVDISTSSSEDCDFNCVPDECQGSADCDDDEVPDVCELIDGAESDCDGNHVPDSCEAGGAVPDCNQNGEPDDCELRQPISYVGTEFVLAFLPIIEPDNIEETKLQLHLVSDENGTATVVYPMNSTNPAHIQQVSISATDVTVVDIGRLAAQAWQPGSVQANAVHVNSNVSVRCIMFNRYLTSSDASAVLPVAALGTDYMAVTSAGTNSPFRAGEFVVVATEDDTTITMNPKNALVGGFQGGTAFNRVLDRGEGFLAKSSGVGVAADLTGSEILSDKPVCVVSGNQTANIPVNLGFANHIFEVMEPITYWGAEYLIGDLPNREDSPTVYRYIAATDATSVFRDGELLAIIDRGEFFEERVGGQHGVHASEPITVAQFMTGTQELGAIIGDPAVVILRSTNQFDVEHVFSTKLGSLPGYPTQFTEHYVTIYAECVEALKESVFLDGVPVATADFQSIPGTSYCVARMQFVGQIGQTEARHVTQRVLVKFESQAIPFPHSGKIPDSMPRMS